MVKEAGLRGRRRSSQGGTRLLVVDTRMRLAARTSRRRESRRRNLIISAMRRMLARGRGVRGSSGWETLDVGLWSHRAVKQIASYSTTNTPSHITSFGIPGVRPLHDFTSSTYRYSQDIPILIYHDQRSTGLTVSPLCIPSSAS